MSNDSLPRSEVAPEQWAWTKNRDPAFHRETYAAALIDNHSLLFDEEKTGRIFVPLCGKTLDMIYLADRGHEVVGLEFSKIGVEDFFEENGLAYSEQAVPGAPFVKYTAIDKNITIFRGDLFDISEDICGKFDACWDRGSFVAINVPTHYKYAELMSSIIKPGGKILMEIVSYDPSKCSGPPHLTSEKDLKEKFSKFDVRMLGFTSTEIPPYYRYDDFRFGLVLLTRGT